MSAAKWFTLGIALLLLGTVAVMRVQLAREPKAFVPKVTVGTKDAVYFEHGATVADALELGHALQTIGFFRDAGGAALVSRGGGDTTVSFVVNDGAWNDPRVVGSYEEIGRRIAKSVGGFPIRVRLTDAHWTERKALNVGKLEVGAKDAIYYFGSATEGDAVALGAALRGAGYLADVGASVVLAKDGGTALGFVVSDGVWDRPDAVAGFEQLVRRVAGVVGGLPIELRLLNAEMETKLHTPVR